MRAAVVQMHSGKNRTENVKRALELIDQAAEQGARFVLLPEYMTFRGPYAEFPVAAETVPGPTCESLAAKAREHSIYVHGGSLVERSAQTERVYNTSVLFDPQGQMIACYRKIHLFDVDVPDGVTEVESSVVLPGDALVVAEVDGFKVGMSICYDLRFPELYRQLAASGAEILVVPSAFAIATGRVHWEVLLRARAIENHAYVLAAAQCGLDEGGSCCYGHSMIIDPWGKLLAAAPEGEQVLLADLDRQEVLRRRQQIPVLKVRRPDLYRRPVTRGAR
jgi:predicted amidohydrolase